MLRRLSRFFAYWDPDSERTEAFSHLNRFAGEHPDAVAELLRLHGGNARCFGQTFYRHLTRRLLARDSRGVIAFAEAMTPLLVGLETPVSRAFLAALCADAREMTWLRTLGGRLRSCWADRLDEVVLRGVQTERLLGIEAEQLAFLRAETEAGFELSHNGRAIDIGMQPTLSVIALYRLMLVWALLRYDVFHFRQGASLFVGAGAAWEASWYEAAGKAVHSSDLSGLSVIRAGGDVASGLAGLHCAHAGLNARISTRIIRLRARLTATPRAAWLTAIISPFNPGGSIRGLADNRWKLALMIRAGRRVAAMLTRGTWQLPVAAAHALRARMRQRRRLPVSRHLFALARYLGERRRARGRARTLWGTTPIVTLPVLARCDGLLGLRSDSLVFTTSYITRDFSLNLRWLDRFAAGASRLWPGAHRAFRFAVLIYVMLRYDAVHLFFDRGVLPGTERFGIEDKEIEWLSRAGAKIYTYAYGADVRTRERTLALGPVNFCTDCPKPGAYCICDEAALAKSLSRLDHRVTARIAMGDMLAYVPGCRNMHYWPLDLARLRPALLDWHKGEMLRIAHAPNHAQFKGTHHLERAVEQLRGEGYAIEIVKISGAPNEQVLELFATAHLVADQFIGGFHGYAALEAMAMGRPVLCYLRGPDMTIAPDECPIINTPPHRIHTTLKAILDGEIDLPDLGRRSRRFVVRHYSLAAVAARLGRLYLETANWPQPLCDDLATRITELEAALPWPIIAPPPIPWDIPARAPAEPDTLVG